MSSDFIKSVVLSPIFAAEYEEDDDCYPSDDSNLDPKKQIHCIPDQKDDEKVDSYVPDCTATLDLGDEDDDDDNMNSQDEGVSSTTCPTCSTHPKLDGYERCQYCMDGRDGSQFKQTPQGAPNAAAAVPKKKQQTLTQMDLDHEPKTQETPQGAPNATASVSENQDVSLTQIEKAPLDLGMDSDDMDPLPIDEEPLPIDEERQLIDKDGFAIPTKSLSDAVSNAAKVTAGSQDERPPEATAGCQQVCLTLNILYFFDWIILYFLKRIILHFFDWMILYFLKRIMLYFLERIILYF